MATSLQTPPLREAEVLLGKALYEVWDSLRLLIEQKYKTDQLWNEVLKVWKYEHKYRRGGKTLCAFYIRENTLGFMVLLGKDERAKFEARRSLFSGEVQRLYDEATTYHDGKWIMFQPKDTCLFADFERLLLIKRKPDK